jgi:hypothetical protein
MCLLLRISLLKNRTFEELKNIQLAVIMNINLYSCAQRANVGTGNYIGAAAELEHMHIGAAIRSYAALQGNKTFDIQGVHRVPYTFIFVKSSKSLGAQHKILCQIKEEIKGILKVPRKENKQKLNSSIQRQNKY